MYVKLSYCHADVGLCMITIHLVTDDTNSIFTKPDAILSIAPFVCLWSEAAIAAPSMVMSHSQLPHAQTFLSKSIKWDFQC